MKIKQLSATQILSAGFALLILAGGALLSLPAASRSGEGLPLLDALFTSASATCVTGLIVRDTWTQFSLAGQAVILLLIQIGGLGFMAVAILFSLAIGRRIGLRERSLLAEAVSSPQVGGVVRLVRLMLIGTAFFEALGTALLAVRFIPLFGVGQGLWFAVFHAVSAFCNAGFDLMGVRSPLSSLTTFQSDPVVILTIGGLIVVGGLGFVVWSDLVESRFHLKKIRLHTWVVMVSTGMLLLVGTLAFLFTEREGVLAAMGRGERLLSALFQSISPRTAGFNSLDIAALTDGGKLVTMLLMFVGAAPGGTGGGVKVTTIAVLVAAVAAQLRASEDVTLWRFRLEADTLRRACCGATVYLLMTVCGILVLCTQGQSLSDAAFECLSAIGTVGLTTGITSSLEPLSQWVIILLMYAGRVGSLTVFMSVVRKNPGGKARNPVGKVMVG